MEIAARDLMFYKTGVVGRGAKAGLLGFHLQNLLACRPIFSMHATDHIAHPD